jgi:metallo-beta-lactamase family protein
VIVFSGDLGPTTLPILREFDPPPRADVVVMESTYGDRDHRGYDETLAEFERIVATVAQARGKILVPTFAIGRAQQILYELARLFTFQKVRSFPVFLDSPMAIEATRVYARYPQLFDEEMRSLREGGVEPLGPGHFRAMVTADESKSLNNLQGPCAILAGSGMCTGGRIVHHLKQNLWKPDSHVLVVGYQARGSLGRQLVDGAGHVAIHGEQIIVRAKIHTLGGFSAHAGQSDLLKWIEPLAAGKPAIYLNHGENAPRAALADQIRKRFGLSCARPDFGETLEI